MVLVSFIVPGEDLSSNSFRNSWICPLNVLTLHDLCSLELPGREVAVQRHGVQGLEPVRPQVEAEVGDVGEDLVESHGQRANIRVADRCVQVIVIMIRDICLLCWICHRIRKVEKKTFLAVIGTSSPPPPKKNI
jgi:hypothetical protein